MQKYFVLIATLLHLTVWVKPAVFPKPVLASPIASEKLSLTNRYPDKYVNDIFRKNILLALLFLKSENKPIKDTDISSEATYEYSLRLEPSEVFAFHDDVLPKYAGKVTKTTGAHFNYSDGFYFSGMYYGDGVCHLASLMHKAAKEAGLTVEAPTRHDFAVIPDIEPEYGTSIFYTPGSYEANSLQNLYITNSQSEPVNLVFTYSEDQVKFAIYKAI